MAQKNYYMQVVTVNRAGTVFGHSFVVFRRTSDDMILSSYGAHAGSIENIFSGTKLKILTNDVDTYLNGDRFGRPKDGVYYSSKVMLSDSELDQKKTFFTDMKRQADTGALLYSLDADPYSSAKSVNCLSLAYAGLNYWDGAVKPFGTDSILPGYLYTKEQIAGIFDHRFVGNYLIQNYVPLDKQVYGYQSDFTALPRDMYRLPSPNSPQYSDIRSFLGNYYGTNATTDQRPPVYNLGSNVQNGLTALEAARGDLTGETVRTENGDEVYIVQKGDSIWKIGTAKQLSQDQLVALNPWLSDQNRISADGQYILIKPGEQVRTSAIENDPSSITFATKYEYDSITAKYGDTTADGLGLNVVTTAEYNDWKRSQSIAAFNLFGQPAMQSLAPLSLCA